MSIFYWFARLNPFHLKNLHARNNSHGIEAIRDFVSTWNRSVPDELINMLSFDECRQLLDDLRNDRERKISHYISPSALKRRVAHKAQHFDEYWYLARLPLNFDDDLDYLKVVLKGLCQNACSFEQYIGVLEVLESFNLIFQPDGRNTPEAFNLISNALARQPSVHYIARIGRFCSEDERSELAASVCKKAQTAYDLIQAFTLDDSKPQVLEDALDLPGDAEDYLKIAYFSRNPAIQLRAIEKAKARLQPAA